MEGFDTFGKNKLIMATNRPATLEPGMPRLQDQDPTLQRTGLARDPQDLRSASEQAPRREL